MKIRLLITLCCVSFLSDYVFAEGESDVKKGNFPFMAFIYYPDESIIEASGLRFLRGAVLVKPEWLITSSIGPIMLKDGPIGFPRKTLLARLGSTSIDANFTLNEDEDEQEREIIQIVRPYNHSEAQWWRNDITLLKTLLPFNMSHAVGLATVRTKAGIIGNSNCFMLIYAVNKRFGNWTEERILMQLYVELQPPAQDICGAHFHEDTMLCAADSEESKSTINSEYCQGNSGGPLICENEVTGLQTYIENNCKPPHLYQLLSAWDNFITCGIKDKCNEEQCSNTCTLINKDEPASEETASLLEQHTISTGEPSKQTEEITLASYATPEMITEEYDTPTKGPTLTTTEEQKSTTEMTTSTTEPTPTPTTMVAESSRYEDTETASWPKDKYPERAKKYEEEDIKIERKTNMEAQKHDVKTRRNAESRIVSVPLSLLVQFVLVSLI